MVHFLQMKRLPQFHRSQTTPGMWSVPHANFTASIMSPKILRRPVLQLQIHLWLVQKLPRLQSRLRTRLQGASRWRSRPRPPMPMGRMSHLQKEGPPGDTQMLQPTSSRRCRRPQNEMRASWWSGIPSFHRTQTQRSWYLSLCGKRTSSPSLLWLRSCHRCRRESDTHSSLCRDWRGQRGGVLLRSGLYAPFLRLARRASCGPRWRRQTCHSHLPQPERIRRDVHPATLLCHTSRSQRPDHCGH